MRWIFLAWIVAGGWTQDDQVKELIERLGAKDIEVREAAVAELFKLGEHSRSALEVASKSKDAEVASRARDLLFRLDAPARERKIKNHSGQVGKTHVFWIEHEAFELLADERNVPEEMQTLLIKGGRLTLVIVEMRDGRVTGSEIAEMVFRTEFGHQEAPRLWHRKRYRANGSSAQGQAKAGWWPEMRSKEATELFRVWPRLRRASLVFVGVGDVSEDLALALGDDRKAVRAAAIYSLRDSFTVETVDAALKALEDKEAVVRDAALETLRAVAMVMECKPEDFRPWWKGLSDRKRQGILSLQEDTAPDRECDCFEKGEKK